MASLRAWDGHSPYDEDEFLGLVTDIYKILIRQGHFREEDIIWEGHKNLDLSVLDDPHLIDPRVVSLMRKVPAGPQSCIVPNMQPVCFLYPGALVRSRDIDGCGRPDGFLDQTNALPTVLLWLDGFEGRDPVLVLDVADNTVRQFDERFKGPHYLDYPAEHAPTYLRRVLENYRTAAWIGDHNGGVIETRPGYSSFGPELQRIMIEDYHWPCESFRRQDWDRDIDGLVGRMIDAEFGREVRGEEVNQSAATVPVLDPELFG
ncbi:hypothetical protein LTR17_019282 [Elasticomyces elasticus]|nr:hypothetical protein LTR17_019282 [Elasticomyces elasticus]